MRDYCKPVVSAILQRTNLVGETEILLQTRWKPQVSPNYTGLLEIPAGAIEAYESVYACLEREIKEETNLELVKIIDDLQTEVLTPRPGDTAFAFKPFICQQVTKAEGGLPWIGFVFLCEVAGELKPQASEAKDPHWVKLEALHSLVTATPEKFFPLQLPVVRYYLTYQGYN